MGTQKNHLNEMVLLSTHNMLKLFFCNNHKNYKVCCMHTQSPKSIMNVSHSLMHVIINVIFFVPLFFIETNSFHSNILIMIQ